MTEILSYKQQTDILQDAWDHLAHCEPHEDMQDIIFEIVDAWVPVYYNHILEQWQLAGCPEPDEVMTIKETNNIFHAMSVGLWETASDYLSSFLYGIRNIGEAMDKISDELDEREKGNR
jgi:hypothetical protein